MSRLTHRLLAAGAFVVVAHAAVAQVRFGGPQLRLARRSAVALRGALPVVQQVAEPAGGGFAVLSASPSGRAVALGLFGHRGRLLRSLAGEGSKTALGRVTAVQSSGRTIWASAFLPPEVAEFSGGHLISVRVLAKPMMAYSLALDPVRALAYVSGLGRPGTHGLLVHRFAFPSFRLLGSSLAMDALVRRDRAIVAQWVPMAVGPRGTVWAVDAPALTLYAVRPSGAIGRYPIRSRIAKPVPPLDPSGATHARWWAGAYWPTAIAISGRRVVVCIRRPHGAGFLLEVFNPSGRQVGTDIPAADRLVGVSREGGLLFARDGSPPLLLRGRLVGVRNVRGR